MSFYRVEEAGAAGNILISPYSVATGLSMLYVGARGETADEIAEVLHSDLRAQELSQASLSLRKQLSSANLKLASALFVSQDVFLLSSFRDLMERSFLAKVGRLDFSDPDNAASVVNNWVKTETGEKIPSLLQKGDLSSSSKLVLAGALFFQEAWKVPFVKENTKSTSFHKTEAEDVSVQMMQGAMTVKYYENDLLQMIALPMEKSAVECLFVLPKSQENEAFLEEELEPSLNDWIEGLESKLVSVQIPKCELRQRIDLAETLEKLGMKLAFTTQANFVGIDGKLDLILSKMITEAYLSLDEGGILAAAGTAASMQLKSTGETPSLKFVADKPFLLILRDRQMKEILLMGKVSNP